MKHYIGEIETYFGESEVSTMVKFKTDIHPEEYLDNVASNFWGDSIDAGDDSVCMHDFGDRMTSFGRWQEVDADTYAKLTIIVEL